MSLDELHKRQSAIKDEMIVLQVNLTSIVGEIAAAEMQHEVKLRKLFEAETRVPTNI